MRRSIAQYVAAPWCALAILLAACTGDGAATEDDRHVENPAPKPETPAEPDTPDTPNNPDNPDSTGNYTPKYESAKAVLKEILGDKYEAISAGMPQNITLTAQTIDAVTGISSVLESVAKASSEEHETENMTDAKTKLNTLTEKAGGLEEALQDTSAEGLEKMLQALVAQAEKMISVSKKEKELEGMYKDASTYSYIDSKIYDISASDGYTVYLSDKFDYFNNHIGVLSGDIDIKGLEIVSEKTNPYGNKLQVPAGSLKEEIYEKFNLEGKDKESLPKLNFDLYNNDDYGLKYFLAIRDKYNNSGKLNLLNMNGIFTSMDGRKLVDVDNYTLFKDENGKEIAKTHEDPSIKSFDISKLIEFATKYNISKFSNLIIYGDAPSETVDWQLTNIIFEGDMSQLTNISETHLKGIVYFKGLPYNNRTDEKGQVVEGAVRLDELSSSIKLQNNLYSILDVRAIDKKKLNAYDQDGKYIHRGMGGMYFNVDLKDLAGNYTLLYSKFTQRSDGGYINNVYFGDSDRADGLNVNGVFPTSRKPRNLSEFEYYGNNSHYGNAAVNSYDNDFSSVTSEQRKDLEADINVKQIAKVSAICPLC